MARPTSQPTVAEDGVGGGEAPHREEGVRRCRKLRRGRRGARLWRELEIREEVHRRGESVRREGRSPVTGERDGRRREAAGTVADG
jgi:hypothetical protein